jgi:hypothetical protein
MVRAMRGASRVHRHWRCAGRVALIAGIACMFGGCTTVVRQSVGSDTHGDDVRLNQNARMRILFAGDSVVEVGRVRIVGDTLYGWRNATSRAGGDSIAIPLARIRTLEQTHVDYWRTAQGVLLGASVAVVTAYVALLVLLGMDHS